MNSQCTPEGQKRTIMNIHDKPSVLVMGTGRCGSTLISNILNEHPRVLSLSEFFSLVGVHRLFRSRQLTGEKMWEFLSHQSRRTRLMLREPHWEEFIYPIDKEGARFSLDDVPPIMCTTLPHLTADHETLFDELEAVIRAQPRQSPGAHLRYLFGWLSENFGADVWAERSGASFLFGSRLLREFPEARIVNIFRDGRETAISMSRHYLFRLIMATLKRSERLGLRPLAMMRRERLWRTMTPWMELIVSPMVRYEQLPFDKLVLSDFAAMWSSMIELGDQMLAQVPDDRVLNLKFEDLQTEPERELRRLIQFIDPELEDEQWMRRASALPRPTPSKFAKLDPAEQAAVTEACRPGLEILGYSH